MAKRLWHRLFGHVYGFWMPSLESTAIRLCDCGDYQQVAVSSWLYGAPVFVDHEMHMSPAPEHPNDTFGWFNVGGKTVHLTTRGPVIDG